MFHTIDFSDIFSSDYSNKISFKKGEIIHSYRDYEEKTPQRPRSEVIAIAVTFFSSFTWLLLVYIVFLTQRKLFKIVS